MLPWVTRCFVPIRVNAMSALYHIATAYGRLDAVVAFASALLRRCADNVAQFVDGFENAFLNVHVYVSRVQQCFSQYP